MLFKDIKDKLIKDKKEILDMATEMGVNKETFYRILRIHTPMRYQGQNGWIANGEMEGDTNITVLYWLGKKILKPITKIQWGVSNNLISRAEVIEIINQIEKYKGADYIKLNDTHKYRIAVYITECLDHVLDSLLVTKKMVEASIKGKDDFKPHMTMCINTIGFCIALKHNIKIQMNTSIGTFKKFYYNSITTTTNKTKSLKTLDSLNINCYVKVILSYTKNTDSIEKELTSLINEKKKFTLLKRTNNLYYFVIVLLLNAGGEIRNDWEKIEFKDLDIRNLLGIKHSELSKNNDVVALNYIYYQKLGIEGGLQGINSYDQEILLLEDEIVYVFKSYKNYLIMNRRGINAYQKAQELLKHKPKNLKKIEYLTVENLKRWIDCYLEYATAKGLKKQTAWRRVNYFCTILQELKTTFETGAFLQLIVNFPFQNHEIRSENKTYRWNNNLNRSVNTANQTLNVMEYSIKKQGDMNEEIRKGTLKHDIAEVDQLVRAIYNYNIQEEPGTIKYFNELQMTTMLRVIADSGVRVSEVINAPYGALSYLKEEDVHICVLGWSKLFERFGVVPIGKETAKMMKKCMKIRREYQDSLITLPILDRTKGKIKSQAEYVLQFVHIHPRHKKVTYISEQTLTRHLDKICKQANISRQPGERFHALRHRSAEYFFFCMSYYDFEYRDDYEYKEMVVKRLLRHRSNLMTKEYNWSALLDLLTEGKLIFMKSLPDVMRYSNVDAKMHTHSIKEKIKKDLEVDLTNPNIDKVIKVLTLPYGIIGDDILEKLSSNKSFKNILDYLPHVDGNKGLVPEGAAYFGMCINFSCPKLKENITCVSCADHILQDKDVPMMIDEILRCNETIQGIYKLHSGDIRAIDHLKSLRSRITSLSERLTKELNYTPTQILEMLAKKRKGEE
ncbi:hypothetical protein [Bacillus pseudomycoides]|uniref:hypothetical protein n=1 Tax=Bacillus pseudomycoides TaxID=64104 RepID=UPI003D650336